MTTDTEQFLATYSGSLKDSLGQTTVENNLYFSPGNLSSHNSDLDFQAQAPFANADYVYDNLSITRLTGLPQDSDWVKQLGWFKDLSSLTTADRAALRCQSPAQRTARDRRHRHGSRI